MVATTGAGWDSVHVFEAVDHTRTASYKLTSTVMLHMTTSTSTLGSMNLSGNLTRQVLRSLYPPSIVSLNYIYKSFSAKSSLDTNRSLFLNTSRKTILCLHCSFIIF